MKLSVLVIGLGFGREFVPLYQNHPNVDRVGICDMDPRLVEETSAKTGLQDTFLDADMALADTRFDAVHIATPVPLHVDQTLKALDAGKHCACAVPMATDLDDLKRIVEAQERSGKTYMMMETGVYTREFLFAKEMLARGELGKVTFLKGAYYQDLEGSYPTYWRAQPPMHYATHVVGPILALADALATKVCCMGSSVLRKDIQQPGGNTFPLETAIFRLERDNLAAEVTRSWFQTAHGYTEAFSVYGDRAGYEWQQIESEDPVVFRLEPVRPGERGRDAVPERVKPPLRPDLYPKELASYADGWHGGSHPHLVHEFVRSIVEGRKSSIDARTAANWCAPGICAHLSALKDGEPVGIPGW